MNFNPSHIGPSDGTFGAQMSASTPSGDSAPTERLTSFRQPRAQGMRIQPVDRSRDQSAGDQPARNQRTRRTVDLPAATHRALDIWQREAADRLGVARVTGQEVLTALIDQLLADPKLAAQVTRAIQERR
ncbi:MAG TPA: ATPase [Mycobacterium sp.]|nr:ATPase [Mycobacterium sp.]